jgi:hypothetical protein
VYYGLTLEDCIEYDKKFPPKELFAPASIDVVLEKLQPDAREAIEKLGFQTVNRLYTKSKRELKALEGVDDKAIEIISEIMKEYGKSWGA